MTKHSHTFLALGDSYTIGESLPLHDCFPYQTVQILRSTGYHFNAPEIIAKTGWTTFELAEKLLHTHLNPPFDFVTLLIGVNNQYRNLLADDYRSDFEFLLKKAIHLSGEKAQHVIVLSIPNWGIMPFANGRDIDQITNEIQLFNSINCELAEAYKTSYIDITTGFNNQSPNQFIAEDGLHPSALEYKRWAELVAEKIKQLLHN